MISDSDLLNFVRQSIQMEIDSIKLVIDDFDDQAFIEELDSQITKYDDIYSEADMLLERFGCEKHDVSAAAKIAAHLSGKMKSLSGTVSKIAESMIQDTTLSLTKLIKYLNEFTGCQEVKDITKRLIKTEEENIEALKKYL